MIRTQLLVYTWLQCLYLIFIHILYMENNYNLRYTAFIYKFYTKSFIKVIYIYQILGLFHLNIPGRGEGTATYFRPPPPPPIEKNKTTQHKKIWFQPHNQQKNKKMAFPPLPPR